MTRKRKVDSDESQAELSEHPIESNTEQQSEVVSPEDVRLLKERCEAAEQRASEEHDKFLRTLADFNNYRRRMREEMKQCGRLAIEDLVIKLLGVLDNLERAISSAEETKNFNTLHGGVILIFRQLLDILEKEGVKPIEAQGCKFDPSLHEVVMCEDTDEYPDNTIIEELRKGYILGERVIRPSAVKVARHIENVGSD